MEKICGRCKRSVSLELFNKRAKSRDGLSSWCRPCYSEYDRERYQNGDKARKEKNKADRLEAVRSYLWELFSNSKCFDCGNRDPEVMEFDHRDPSQKSFTISHMLRSYSLKRIQAEIAKCDIVCANCHRKRTIQQFGTWRGILGHGEDG